jgi:purine nucleoside phosphorylase
MSTVLETIAARALGRDVVGFSLITNVHGNGANTSHEDLARRSRLVEGIVANLEPNPEGE